MVYIRSLELIHVITLTIISPFFPPPAPGNHYSRLCFYEFHHTIQYLSFCVWLISLSITSSRFIHVVLIGRIFFFIMAEDEDMTIVKNMRVSSQTFPFIRGHRKPSLNAPSKTFFSCIGYPPLTEKKSGSGHLPLHP